MLTNQHVDNLKIVNEKKINLSRNQIGRIKKKIIPYVDPGPLHGKQIRTRKKVLFLD